MTAGPITIVVARARNGVIGRDGKLPWHIPADLKRFKALTMGSAMIMGRKTFDSLPGRLPGRRHIVLTRDPRWHAEGAEVARSVDAALKLAGDGPVSVIGGADIFALFLPMARRIELTEVLADVDGDTRMDDPRETGNWTESWSEDHAAAEGRPGFRFITLTRTPADESGGGGGRRWRRIIVAATAVAVAGFLLLVFAYPDRIRDSVLHALGFGPVPAATPIR